MNKRQLAEFQKVYAEKKEQALLAEDRGKSWLNMVAKTAPLPLGDRPLVKIRDLKSRDDIMKKVERGLSNKLRLRDAWDAEVNDFTGGRIITHYLCDLCILYFHLLANVGSNTGWRCKQPGDCEAYVKQGKTGSGWRGVKQTLITDVGSAYFPFEVQIMTYLQHDWDQKEHPVYKRKDLFDATVRQMFIDLSDQLYGVDSTTNRLAPIIRKATSGHP